ncbi:MAG: hypothetical protein ABSB35_31790, partial [Bryobacteraceae bacterium]
LEHQPQVTTAPSRSWFGWVAAGVLAIALFVLGALYWRATRSAELKPLVRLDVDLGPDVSLGSLGGAAAIISPDGARMVYVSQDKLFTRRMDQPKAAELVGSEGASAPFFSPDGQWVAFFASGKLKKVSVAGGMPVALCDASTGTGASGSWGEDGNIIAVRTNSGFLWQVPSAGGAPKPATELVQGEVAHRWPQILLGGKAVLFTASTSLGEFDGANIEVVSLADHRRKTLVRGGTFGRYLPSGHLAYVNRGTLFAVPFDLDTLTARGTPAPLLDDVAYSATTGDAQFDFSGVGTLVYRRGGANGLLTAQWLDGGGKTRPLLPKPGLYGRPRLSPDGQRLALEVTEGSSYDTWVYDLQRDNMTRLTFGAGAGAMNPVWSPDGRYIVFQGAGGLFWTRSDGADKPQPLTQSKSQQFPWSFTPDGKRLAWNEQQESESVLWSVPVEGGGVGLRAAKPEVLLQTSFDLRHPMFSPDGRWLAYTSNESGTYQVYVRAFPDKGGKWQISNSGGSFPVWSDNGRELFFRNLDSRVMVAAYAAKGDSFVADKPRVWSEQRIADMGAIGGRTYDLAPDGKRVAALMTAEGPEAQAAQNHVIFLENFFDELRRRIPVNK